MALLEIKNLMKVYGKGNNEVKAVNDINISIEQGEFVAIMGSSGCGKSTLLHLIGGVDDATSGSITIQGVDITSLKENDLILFRREHIGIVYQFYNLLPVLTVSENIVLPLKLANHPVDEEKLNQLLLQLNLKGREHHLPSQLSGGQQQRVAFARTILSEPDIILADEPTGNLDSDNSKEVMEYIKEFHKNEEKTIILVTHDYEIAKQADKIYVMEDGKIVKEEICK